MYVETLLERLNFCVHKTLSDSPLSHYKPGSNHGPNFCVACPEGFLKTVRVSFRLRYKRILLPPPEGLVIRLDGVVCENKKRESHTHTHTHKETNNTFSSTYSSSNAVHTLLPCD